MKRRCNSRMSPAEQVGRIIDLGRAGMAFAAIGKDVELASATAHEWWHRHADDDDRRVRDLAARAGGGSHLSRRFEMSASLREIGDPFAGQHFPDHPQALSERLPGRCTGAEPFGFSLYGGTLV